MKTTFENKSIKAMIMICVIASGVLLQDHSFADSSSATMGVSVVVQSNCKLDVNTVSFGTYDPANANETQPLVTSSNINLKCTRGSTANVSIDSGLNQGRANGSARAMANTTGSGYLAYELYTDSGRQQLWDAHTTVKYYANTSETTGLNVYAKIPANQAVPNGNYYDELTITVTY